MANANKRSTLPEWASRISALRRNSKMSQGGLARRLQCSAMTVSRWERGLQAPTAYYYIQLGNMAGKDNCCFFWELAGLQMCEVSRSSPPLPVHQALLPSLQNARAGSGARVPQASAERIVALPIN